MAPIIYVLICLGIFLFAHHCWAFEHFEELRERMKKRSDYTRLRFERIEMALSNDRKREMI